MSNGLRFGRWRLSSRIAGFSLLLLLLVQLAGFAAIRASIQRNAQAQLSEQLAVGERTWRRLLDQRAAKLTQGGAVLAADYAFREAVGTQDIPTIVSVLDNHGARIDANLTALLGTDLAVRATGDSSDAALLPVLTRLAPQLARQGSAIAAVGDRAYQFVMVPMRAPVLVGWVVMGFVLDASVAADILAVSGVHGTLVLEPANGAPRVLLTSLPPALPAAAVAAGPSEGELLLAGAQYRVHGTVLSDEAGQRLGLRLTGSLERAIEPYRDLQVTLAGLTALGVFLFGLGSAWTARRVTRPLSDLAEASERLGRGDYAASLQHTERADEVGDLAKAFDHMRVNIAAQQTEIRQLAYWDRLTDLPNRVQFRDAVRSAIEAGSGNVAVLMLDLDRFKNVNDALGYASGDALLKGVAARLQEVARSGDMVARLGGDEFALLMPQADAAQAVALAERLAQAFEQPLTVEDQMIDLSAGVGIACWPEHAADADALLSRAEVAMYAAKARTAGAQVYDPATDSSSATNLSLLSELRHALDHQELRLFLQPKIHLASGRAIAAEALVRWQHPQRGLVPPMLFIPFAEQTGFIRRLTLWIFEETARVQPALQRLGVQRISVNLSTRDLLDQELPDKLDALLRRHGALPEAFCLEITESAIMDDPQRAEATLNRLSERGYKLSIDDFGTGYSSLAYLKRLPVDELKIDKSFVMAMEGEAGDAKIVRSTIDLAHNLGLTVVAEGVENAAILEQLRLLHCDEAQGYHMSKPLPVPEFEAWVVKWAAQAPHAAASAAALGS
ncbi:EAL domain-containing protein [Aquincola sp. S2]|uniref:EAL domain-containing protein n=1 Tax=Pseudaquabacterium terrae TaxID=2732868 RepID=A0ABX2EB23_9BURK|nr:EAL domain-containing protein [Aquabacterium terrae]NRF66321.1 EAL domain-containing protein [Aquabacterium terrae]